MKIIEVYVRNPITHQSIRATIDKIICSKNYDFLIVNLGQHHFESLKVMKDFKQAFLDIKSKLYRFKKIAIIHSTERLNKSEDPNFYEHFNSKTDAIKWIRS
ncbi:MAG: hypothetical protein D8M58_19125 [Calditrichaeota bacterium]|nr:MAG: hypothetical protein DWQ03_21805 [Calditrichota bacterium]MBL1207524.1 hypothetical protein [Calditrichota bacterium]NOG47356.1 hypothetical protein [Calditrichota bacterium]